jgi:predicted dienelactone hydrolase
MLLPTSKSRDILSAEGPRPRAWFLLPFLALAACGDNGAARPGDDAGAAEPAPGASSPASPASPTPNPTAADAGPEAGAAGVSSYATTVSGSNDPADIYYPMSTNPAKDSLPVVVLAQGAKVDKANYSVVAKQVAGYGFAVIVPNHKRTVIIDTNLYPEASSVLAAFAHVVAESKRSGGPLAGLVDTSKWALLGHSFGGALGANMLGGTCSIPFCTPPYAVPPELKAGAFYGASLKPPFGPIPATANAGRGIALIQGSVDGKNAAADAKATYDKIATAPRAYVVVTGANHYGISDVDNPKGADADAQATSLAQAVATETVGRWAGTFLRATVLGDAAAKAQFKQTAANVTVESAL